MSYSYYALNVYAELAAFCISSNTVRTTLGRDNDQLGFHSHSFIDFPPPFLGEPPSDRSTRFASVNGQMYQSITINNPITTKAKQV